MVTTKVGTLENVISYEKPTKTPLITLNSDEVAWLFGIDNTVLEQWVNAGTLTSSNITGKGIRLFWQKDVAALLDAFGA